MDILTIRGDNTDLILTIRGDNTDLMVLSGIFDEEVDCARNGWGAVEVVAPDGAVTRVTLRYHDDASRWVATVERGTATVTPPSKSRATPRGDLWFTDTVTLDVPEGACVRAYADHALTFDSRWPAEAWE